MAGRARNRKDPARTAGGRRSGIRRLGTLNIGTVVFGVLFVYILITMFLYLTATHIRSYQVTQGPLAANTEYTGFALMNDTLVTANATGYVDLYAENHGKIRSGGIVYGTSPQKAETSPQEADAATLSRIREKMSEYARDWDAGEFYTIYSLKYTAEGELVQQSVSSASADAGMSLTVGTITVATAAQDGIVCYETDGYEGKVSGDLSYDDFDEKQYTEARIRPGDSVTSGDAVYRLITSEDWSLLIPLTSHEEVRLQDLTSVKVRFKRDGATETAAFSLISLNDGTTCGKLDFTRGLIRYLDSRYIDIELVTNTQVGLKIPVTAVTTRSFYTIPEEYAAYAGNSGSVGFYKSVTNSTGEVSSVFVTPTIYEHKGGVYYVDGSNFASGDIVTREGSSDRYIIRGTSNLEGVYNMNKGYALFRRVNIIDKNEEYCIVEKGDLYGIAEYDNIVEDASTVSDSQITVS